MMGNAVIIHEQMPAAQAEALLVALREQYRMNLNEYWYADQFRLVTDRMRHGAIVAQVPVMAAQKQLIGALSLSLNALKQS